MVKLWDDVQFDCATFGADTEALQFFRGLMGTVGRHMENVLPTRWLTLASLCGQIVQKTCMLPQSCSVFGDLECLSEFSQLRAKYTLHVLSQLVALSHNLPDENQKTLAGAYALERQSVQK